MVHSVAQGGSSIPTALPKKPVLRLTKRLSAALWGNRELDRDIGKLIDVAVWDECAKLASQPCGAPPATIERDALRWLPHYTTSMDAALDLARRAAADWLVMSAGQEMDGKWGVVLVRRDEWSVCTQGLHQTPAMALCLAVLRSAT